MNPPSAHFAILGSPPLARGTAPANYPTAHTNGITPACAGNSPARKLRRSKMRDHPRLRGEQSSNFDILAARSGSPPLARGTGARYSRTTLAPRITPACAGNSMRAWRMQANGWDHPRLRGEQALFVYASFGFQGSPPLARGTAASATAGLWRGRITPACAGNSFCPSPPPCGRWDHPRLRGEQLYFFLL